MGGEEKHSKQGEDFRTVGAFSIVKSFLWFTVLSSWYREGDTFTNGNLLYKCKFPLQMGKVYFVFRTSVSAVSQK